MSTAACNDNIASSTDEVTHHCSGRGRHTVAGDVDFVTLSLFWYL